MKLENRVAIITGAAQGIGRAIAELFAREGARCSLWDLNEAGLAEVARGIREVGGHARYDVVNVADRSAVERAMEAVVASEGQLEILINNAGIVRDASLKKMSEDDFDAVISVNLKGVFNCAQAALPHLVARGWGRIVNASSVVGLYGNFGQTNYVAAKAGVVGMTRTWAREMGPKGICVNAIAPGFIATEMVQTIPQPIQDTIVAKIPLKRMGQVDEVARAYLFLASEDASYINGAVLSVDGGMVG